MRISRLDRKLIPASVLPHHMIMVNERFAVAFVQSRSRTPRYVAIKLDTGSHEPMEVPHIKFVPITAGPGLYHVALDRRTRTGDLLGLYKVSVPSGSVHKLLELNVRLGPLYKGLSSVHLGLRVHAPSKKHVWITIRPEMMPANKHSNFLYDLESSSLSSMGYIEDHIYDCQMIDNAGRAFYALRLGDPDPVDKDYAWREFGSDGLSSESIVIVPRQGVCNPEKFRTVERAQSQSALGWLFQVVGDRVLYTIHPFGKQSELRFYDPVTSRLEQSPLNGIDANPVLVNDRPFIVRQVKLGEYYLIGLEDAQEICFPQEWGEPLRILDGIVYTCDYQTRKYRAYNLSQKTLLHEGTYLLFRKEEPVLLV